MPQDSMAHPYEIFEVKIERPGNAISVDREGGKLNRRKSPKSVIGKVKKSGIVRKGRCKMQLELFQR